jgi:hypothetical protein
MVMLLDEFAVACNPDGVFGANPPSLDALTTQAAIENPITATKAIIPKLAFKFFITKNLLNI